MNTDWAQSYNYTPGDAVELDWAGTKAMFPDSANTCMLVAIDWRSISTLISVLRFAEYWHIWGLPTRKEQWSEAQKAQWYEITAHIAELENCLMSGCNVQDLITTNRMIVAALIGQNVDLTTALPSQVDFTENGVSPRLLAISDAIGGGESIEDDLQNIQSAISAIAVLSAA